MGFNIDMNSLNYTDVLGWFQTKASTHEINQLVLKYLTPADVVEWLDDIADQEDREVIADHIGDDFLDCEEIAKDWLWSEASNWEQKHVLDELLDMYPEEITVSNIVDVIETGYFNCTDIGDIYRALDNTYNYYNNLTIPQSLYDLYKIEILENLYKKLNLRELENLENGLCK